MYINIMQTPTVNFPLTRAQLLALKTEQDVKTRKEMIQRHVNEISNSITLLAKQGKTTFSSNMMLPSPIMLTIKDDVINGLKTNFPDSELKFDNIKNVIVITWA